MDQNVLVSKHTGAPVEVESSSFEVKDHSFRARGDSDDGLPLETILSTKVDEAHASYSDDYLSTVDSLRLSWPGGGSASLRVHGFARPPSAEGAVDSVTLLTVAGEVTICNDGAMQVDENIAKFLLRAGELCLPSPCLSFHCVELERHGVAYQVPSSNSRMREVLKAVRHGGCWLPVSRTRMRASDRGVSAVANQGQCSCTATQQTKLPSSRGAWPQKKSLPPGVTGLSCCRPTTRHCRVLASIDFARSVAILVWQLCTLDYVKFMHSRYCRFPHFARVLRGGRIWSDVATVGASDRCQGDFLTSTSCSV